MRTRTPKGSGSAGTAVLRSRRPPHASPPEWTLEDYLEFALGAGYVGAWPWSFSGTDPYGPLPEEPLRAFAGRHPELVNQRALGSGL